MAKTFKQSLIDLLAPMFYSDTQYSNSLDTYVGSLSDPLFQVVDDWASDGDKGEPGYSILLDVRRCPDNALPWLAQFVGAKLTVGLSAAQQREQLAGLGNWKRGTVAALQAAPLPYLTGTQYVQVKERDTSPYHLQVLVYANENTDPAKVQAALLTQKPAGLVMTFVNFAGQGAFRVRGSTLRGSPADALRLVI